MHVPARTVGLLAAVAVALSVAGCAAGGCRQSRIVLVPASTTARPGQPVELRGYVHVDVYGRGIGFGEITEKRDQVVEDATWAASGPGPYTLRRISADRSVFTASRPGTYTVECDATRPAVARGEAMIFVGGRTLRPGEAGSLVTTPIPAGPPVVVLDTFNELGIRPGGLPPTFTVSKPATVLTVQTYHYLAGGGPEPGTLALRSAEGKTYGPWKAFGLAGRSGTANALWNADPIVSIPAGTYTVVDSHPATWSSNDTARGVGFTRAVVVYDP
jgi:hypothetical protein